MDKDCFKTPPNMVNSNHARQGQPKNNTNKIPMSSPSPTQPLPSSSMSPSTSQNAATAPKRIINKIPLDFNKLKQAGLDRKLAEVLSKQNVSSAKKIASATTTSLSSSTSPSFAASAAKLSTATATQIQPQRQRERQTAAVPVRKKLTPNLVAVDEQSLHIKALIKNKILNKMSKPPVTTTTTTTPASPDVNTSPSSSFTVPIAKADITARPKLLLNLVNQLPKHRAMCGVSSPQARARQHESPPQPAPQSKVRQQPSAPSQLKPRQQQAQPATAPKPLIVLENKVLAPNEKIDLRALRLPKIHTTEETSLALPPKVISVPEKLKEIPDKTTEKGKGSPRILQLGGTTPGSGAKKFILNANKLKVPREQLAQMAKNIRQQAMQQVQQPVTKLAAEDHEVSSNISGISSIPSTPTTLITLTTKSSSIQQSLITPVRPKASPKPKSTTSQRSSSTVTATDALATAPSSNKSLSSASAEPSTNVISAVDFIAQLKANNSLDVSNYMNLSAEELSMNALFSGGPTALTTSEESRAEEELPIGKIMKMEDMDILHATMNVDENESNVLCISPNAIKLQRSIEIEDLPVAKESASMQPEPNALKKTLEPVSSKNNLSLAAAPTVVVIAPLEETKMSEEAKLPEKQAKEVPLAQLVPLATRLPFRPKKGKINLVQRNKRTSAGKLKTTEETDKKTDEKISTFISQEDDNKDSEGNIPAEIELPKELDTKRNIKTADNEEIVKDEAGFKLNNSVIESQVNVDTSANKDIDENSSQVAEVQETHTESNKKSIDKEENVKEKRSLITEVDIEINNVNKIDNTIGKENISTDAEVQETESVEMLKNEEKTKLDTTNDSEVNVDFNNSDANIPKQAEQPQNLDKNLNNKTADKNECEIEKIENEKEKSKTKLDSSVESKANEDNEVCKEVISKDEEVQRTIDTKHKRSVDKEENEEIVKKTSQNNLNINRDNQFNADNSAELASSKETEKSLCNQVSATIKNVISPKKETVVELKTSAETIVETQSIEVPVNTTKERDLMELNYPPKMSKPKQKINNNNEVSNSKAIPAETQSTVSLLEVLSQQEPTPQGEAQLPFRQDSKKTISAAKTPTEVRGIKNLLNKLAAENVVPPSKESIETKPEEPVKAPRKKLVKTRPVLSAKRAVKAVPPKTEAVHPRKRALLVENKTNGSHRIPTSSTSDDDGDMFHGFDNEATSSNNDTNLKNIGTDISDDATPDYDETEEDPQPDEESLAKQPKTEPASTNQKLKTIAEQIDKETDKKAKEQKLAAIAEKIDKETDKKAKEQKLETITEQIDKETDKKAKEQKLSAIAEQIYKETDKKAKEQKLETITEQIDKETDKKAKEQKLAAIAEQIDKETDKKAKEQKLETITEQIDKETDKKAKEQKLETIEDKETDKKAKEQRLKTSTEQIDKETDKKTKDQNLKTIAEQLDKEIDKTAREEELEIISDQTAEEIVKKPKKQKLKSNTEQIDKKIEKEASKTAQVEKSTEIQDNSNSVTTQEQPVVEKRKRGRPFKNANKIPEQKATSSVAAAVASGVDKTEEKETAMALTRKRKRQSKDISIEVSTVQQDSLSGAEETPVAKRPRKGRSQNATPIAAPAELNTSMEPATNTVKRRGRQKKILTAEATATPDHTIEATPEPMITSTPDALNTSTQETIFTPKKRGRRPKFFNLLALSKKIKTEDNAEITDELGVMIKLEGPDYWPQTPDFDLRLLLIRNRSQLESGEELRENNRGEGSEQCGLCLVRCDKKDWMTHLSEHYGVGWPIDNSPPMITRGMLIVMMTSYAKGGNRLSCRLCARSLGSGLGMMLHLEGCGIKQERVECEACKNSYSKLFIAQHFRTCFKRLQPKDTSTEVPSDDSASTTVYSNAGRAKRKSTIKAETKLQKIAAHLKKPEIEATVQCDINDDSSDYDQDADKESSEEYESEGVDSNEEADQTRDCSKSLSEESFGVTKELNKSSLSGVSATTTRHPNCRIAKTGVVSGERWKFFLQTNYAQDTLYPHLLPRYDQLSPADALKLLPSRESTSMRYCYNSANDNDWIQLTPLESFNRKDEFVCYLGKPVKELAWVPLPSSVDTQYLLCSQRSKMLGFTRQLKDKHEDDLLLLLEFTMSSARKDKAWPLQSRLHYGIQVPQGPVNTFAFMPSGGYDKSANRLALLAVGSASRAVVYALPLELPKTKKDAKKKVESVIIMEAVFTLSFEVDDPVRDPCTKICWSQASGHSLIVSGYASGNIAFWDIADEDGINCFELNNQRHFLPTSFFYFGERNIQSLELHYDSNGAHWLAVSAAVRRFWIYDITNWSQPLPMLGDVIHNLYLGCISWSPLWESLVIGNSELSRAQFTRLISLNPVDTSNMPITLDVLLNSIRAVHFNCEQVMLASIADNGDVALIKINEFSSQTLLRRQKNHGPLSTTEASYLSDGTEPKHVTADVFQRDYGLTLRPIRTNLKKDNSSSYQNPKRQPSFNLRSMMRLNCVRWNWNAPASSWLAVGAEHGLLRIMNYEPDK